MTISASFAAGGNVVGPAAAEKLGLPFVDRAIPLAAAERLSMTLQRAIALDDKGPSGWSRLAEAFGTVATPLAFQPIPEDVVDPATFREETAAIMIHLADSTGGVFLGRAGMVVLGNRPDVLSVRLDGPVERRIARAIREGLGEDEARSMQKEVDGAREAYSKVFYGARQSDPSLYHVILDATALEFSTCTDIIVTAARDHLNLPVRMNG